MLKRFSAALREKLRYYSSYGGFWRIDVPLDHPGFAAAFSGQLFTEICSDIIAVEIAAPYYKGISSIIIAIEYPTIAVMPGHERIDGISDGSRIPLILLPFDRCDSLIHGLPIKSAFDGLMIQQHAHVVCNVLFQILISPVIFVQKSLEI